MGTRIAAMLVLLPGLAHGARVVQEIRFPGPLPNARTENNAEGRAKTVGLVSIDRPGIGRSVYAMSGLVCHKGVEGKAYLELWSHFPDGSRYVSRTLASAGPMKSIEGSSDRRPFVLPFTNRPGAPGPSKLELNLVLPGRGAVTVEKLRLLEYDAGEDPLDVTAASPSWWSERAGGLVGGIGGSAVGLLGALVGVLAGLRRGRRLALAVLVTLMVCGAASLLAGAIAVYLEQPAAVYLPLLLPGFVSFVVPGLLRNIVRRRFAA